MFRFLVRRLLYLIPTLWAVSIVAFIIIQLPPGDYTTTYMASLSSSGEAVDQQVVNALKERYGFDQPLPVQYFKWIGNIVTAGDFGQSFEWNAPVNRLIWDR